MIDIMFYFIIGMSLFVTVHFIRDIMKSSKKIKEYNIISRNMSMYQWLVDTGMHEQAKHFNAFGLLVKDHNPYIRY